MSTVKSIIKVVLVIFCFSSVIVMAQDDTLIHQYKFDGNLEDAVGDSNGVVDGGPGAPIYIEGHDGTANGAIFFSTNSTDWYMIEVGRFSPSQEGTINEMTVTFWAFWLGSTNNPQDIINKRDYYNNDHMMWGINQHAGTGHVLSVHTPGSKANSSQGIPDSIWTHVAISLDGVNASFYMNGKLYDSQKFTYGTGYNSIIHIGTSANMYNPNFNDIYNGALDDVRFYSRVLTDAEVLGVFQGASAIGDESPAVATQFELVQNYPNPFNPQTTIKYQLPEKTQVSLKVFDITGHEVATLVKGEQAQGNYSVKFDGNNMPSGIYFYQLQTNEQILNKRMLLLK